MKGKKENHEKMEWKNLNDILWAFGKILLWVNHYTWVGVPVSGGQVGLLGSIVPTFCIIISEYS